MKVSLFLILFFCFGGSLFAQQTYTIKADSVKITNCDSSELIIENHTQAIPGFLYNTGNGRTQFRRGVIKVNGGLYLIGADTLNLNANAWMQGGNSFGATGVLGTIDNNPLDLYTNDTGRVRITNTGQLLVGAKTDIPPMPGMVDKLYVNGNSYLAGTFVVGYTQKAYMGNGIIFDLYGTGPTALSRIFSEAGFLYQSQAPGNQHYFQNQIGGAFTGNLVTMDPGYYPQLVDSQMTLNVLNKWRAPALSVSVGGNVGIATAYPTANLHAAGTVRFSGLTSDSTKSRVLVSDSLGNIFYRSVSGLPGAATAWTQGGNAFGTTGVLGTLDNHHLDLYTNDSGRVRLDSAGNLLVGTTTDQGQRLQVSGASLLNGKTYIDASEGSGTGDLFIKNLAGNYTDFIGTSGYDLLFQTRTAADNFRFWFGGNARNLNFNGNAGGDIQITSSNTNIDLIGVKNMNTEGTSITISSDNYSNGDGVVFTRGTRSIVTTDPILTIKENDTIVLDALKNGNVGIGTNTPSAQLHTTGSVRFTGLTSDSTQTRVLVSDINGNLYYRSASSIASNGVLNSSLAGDNIFRSSLTVKGGMKAQSLRLKPSGWADYVFTKGYHLPSLNEVDLYIQQNNHLPGVSSAAEVVKNGVDVGDNQVALLKKIEELTLYVIEQEKKLQTQQAEIAALKERSKDLQELKQEMAELRKLLEK